MVVTMFDLYQVAKKQFDNNKEIHDNIHIQYRWIENKGFCFVVLIGANDFYIKENFIVTKHELMINDGMNCSRYLADGISLNRINYICINNTVYTGFLICEAK